MLPISDSSEASIKQSVDSFDAAFARHVKSNEKSNMTKPPEARSKGAGSFSFVLSRGPTMLGQVSALAISWLHMVPEEVGAVGKSVLHVGVQAGASTSAAEKGWQASLRLSISGTKTILACSAETAIATFGVMDPTALWQKFLQMSPEDVQRMVDLQRKEITLWQAQLDPMSCSICQQDGCLLNRYSPRPTAWAFFAVVSSMKAPLTTSCKPFGSCFHL